jgi:permuted papain-like amidase YaeF/Yiix C92 family enzyme
MSAGISQATVARPRSLLERLNPFVFLRHKFAALVVRILTKPLRRYTLFIPNDMGRLKRFIRKGDVVLVEGNERISECIKYLTQSSWSHVALYVGDEPLRRDPELKKKLIAEFGEEANHLVVEALVESGVTLSPIGKYRDFNLRVCRPYNLANGDLKRVVDEALLAVGATYDIRNVVDLARYFLPVSLVPRRFRRKALQFGSGEPTRVICSSLIAECFEHVKFPIVPSFEELPLDSSSTQQRGLRRLISRPDARSYGVLRRVSPTIITPRDFDLSPYFEIIKFNVIEESKFDYRKLVWADDETSAARKLEKSA